MHLLHVVKLRQIALKQRVDEINTTFIAQKDMIESCIAQGLYIHNHVMNPQEKKFQQKVQVWRKYLSALESSLCGLEKPTELLFTAPVTVLDSVASSSVISSPHVSDSVRKSDQSTPFAQGQGNTTPKQSMVSNNTVGGTSASKTVTGAVAWYTRNRASRLNTPMTGGRSVLNSAKKPVYSPMMQSPVPGLSGTTTISESPLNTMLSSMSLHPPPPSELPRPYGSNTPNQPVSESKHTSGGVSLSSLVTSSKKPPLQHKTTTASMSSFVSPLKEKGVNTRQSTSTSIPVTNVTLFNSPGPISPTNFDSPRDRNGFSTSARHDGSTVENTIHVNVDTINSTSTSVAIGTGGTATSASTGGVVSGYTVREKEFIKELLLKQVLSVIYCTLFIL